MNGKSHINCINIYSPLDLKEKRLLWDHIGGVISHIGDEPLCIMGDFNCILDASKKDNCIYNRRDTSGFKLFLHEYDFKYIPLIYSKFTWFGP